MTVNLKINYYNLPFANGIAVQKARFNHRIAHCKNPVSSIAREHQINRKSMCEFKKLQILLRRSNSTIKDANVPADQLHLLYNFYNETDFRKFRESSLPKDLVKRMCDIAREYQIISKRFSDMVGTYWAGKLQRGAESEQFDREVIILYPKIENHLSELIAYYNYLKEQENDLREQENNLFQVSTSQEILQNIPTDLKAIHNQKVEITEKYKIQYSLFEQLACEEELLQFPESL